MLNSVSYLNGSKIAATDGEIGHVREAYFDDEKWTIRYLVVDTGNLLAGRDVLVSPYSVAQPLGSGKIIDVSLTTDQVRNSPAIDTHQPVSRRHEQDYLGYYAFPEYWEGGALWAMSALPVLPAPLPTTVESEAQSIARERNVAKEDVHLCSSATVAGYDIHASDGSIGHVKDFIFDDETWTIRYLVVDTRNWWPGGAKVLIATHWIERTDWADKEVFTSLTREQVKNSPRYEEAKPISREYEKQLHGAYSRTGYWD